MIIKRRLIIKTNDKLLHANNLNRPENKIELYYHYAWGSNVKTLYQDIGSGQKDEGYLADHISFHEDGHVHYKIRDKNGKIDYHERFPIGLNPFNLERANYLPIYIESFDLSNDEFNSKRFTSIETIEPTDIVFDVSDLKHFSILTISKCARVNPDFILTELGLNQSQIIDNPFYIRDFYTAKEKAQYLQNSHTEFNTEFLLIAFRKIIPKTPLLYQDANAEPIENINAFKVLPLMEYLKTQLSCV